MRQWTHGCARSSHGGELVSRFLPDGCVALLSFGGHRGYGRALPGIADFERLSGVGAHHFSIDLLTGLAPVGSPLRNGAPAASKRMGMGDSWRQHRTELPQSVLLAAYDFHAAVVDEAANAGILYP